MSVCGRKHIEVKSIDVQCLIDARFAGFSCCDSLTPGNRKTNCKCWGRARKSIKFMLLWVSFSLSVSLALSSYLAIPFVCIRFCECFYTFRMQKTIFYDECFRVSHANSWRFICRKRKLCKFIHETMIIQLFKMQTKVFFNSNFYRGFAKKNCGKKFVTKFAYYSVMNWSWFCMFEEVSRAQFWWLFSRRARAQSKHNFNVVHWLTAAERKA